MVIWHLIRRTWRKWRDDQATRQGAALAFYALFAAAPTLLVASILANTLFGEDEGGRWLHQQLSLLATPEVASTVEGFVAGGAHPNAGVKTTLLGLLATTYAGARGFLHLQTTLNNLWGVRQVRGPGVAAIVFKKGWAFASILSCGSLLLASLLGSLFLQLTAHQLAEGLPEGLAWVGRVNELGTFFLSAVLLAVVFRTLPDVKIGWREVAFGALFTAALFAIGKHAIAWYLQHAVHSQGFGSAGSVVAVLLYVYYSAQVLLIGAEFTWVFAETSGTPIVPNARAARVIRTTVPPDAPQSAREQ